LTGAPPSQQEGKTMWEDQELEINQRAIEAAAATQSTAADEAFEEWLLSLIDERGEGE